MSFKHKNYDDMRNDPENYKWGFFYYNPDDPRTIVPKRIKEFGWTLNFASPYSYLIIVSIIILGFVLGSLDKILK